MTTPVESYRVLWGASEDPTSDAGRALFAAMFEEEPEASAVQTFTVSVGPGTHLDTHRHTAGLAACVTGGRITFVFGADGTDRVELHAGDWVWIRAGVMHDEETPEDESAEMVVAHLEPFETLET